METKRGNLHFDLRYLNIRFSIIKSGTAKRDLQLKWGGGEREVK